MTPFGMGRAGGTPLAALRNAVIAVATMLAVPPPLGVAIAFTFRIASGGVASVGIPSGGIIAGGFRRCRGIAFPAAVPAGRFGHEGDDAHPSLHDRVEQARARGRERPRHAGAQTDRHGGDAEEPHASRRGGRSGRSSAACQATGATSRHGQGRHGHGGLRERGVVAV